MASERKHTPYAVIMYPNLFQPRKNDDGTEGKYSTALDIPVELTKTPEYKALQEIVVEAAEEMFGSKWKERKLRLPFKPITDAAGKEFIRIEPKTKYKPQIIDRNGQDVLIPDEVWAGQICKAEVHAFGYDTGTNKGVAFGLGPVRIAKSDMPRKDGRKSAQEVFADVVDDDSVLESVFEVSADDHDEDTAPATKKASKASAKDALMDDLV